MNETLIHLSVFFGVLSAAAVLIVLGVLRFFLKTNVRVRQFGAHWICVAANRWSGEREYARTERVHYDRYRIWIDTNTGEALGEAVSRRADSLVEASLIMANVRTSEYYPLIRAVEDASRS